MFVEAVDSLTPPWAKGGAVPHWLRLFRFCALLVDIMIEGAYQARRAGLPDAVDLPGVPGYAGFEDVKALRKYLAPDAGVYQGLTELPPELAQRVRHAQDPAPMGGGWPSGGLIFGVLEQLAGVLAGTGGAAPLMRIVNRQGDWWTRNVDGSYSFVRVAGDGLNFATDGTVTANTTAGRPWNWDGSTVPPPPTKGEAGDWWLIVDEPLNVPYGTTDDATFNDPGECADLWNSPAGNPYFGSPGAPENAEGGTIGTNAPQKLVELIRGVIAQRQTVGLMCLWIIVVKDMSISPFDPDSTHAAPSVPAGTAYPDGRWGWHATYDAATHARVIARNPGAEYWLGPRYPGQAT